MPTEKVPSESELILVRHGETDSNAQDVWQGMQGDDPLNERGRLQSLAVADYLTRYSPVKALYSSDLRRAIETAEMIGVQLNLPVKMHTGLREYDFGFLEGATTSEAQGRWHELLDRWRSEPTYKPHGGESAFDFAVRVNGAFQEILAQHPTGRVIVVAHGGSLSIGLAVLVGEPQRWQAYQMSNCSVTIVAMKPRPTIAAFEETSHLVDIGTATWGGAGL
jgi:broad specificity phosphatase PhoE